MATGRPGDGQRGAGDARHRGAERGGESQGGGADGGEHAQEAGPVGLQADQRRRAEHDSDQQRQLPLVGGARWRTMRRWPAANTISAQADRQVPAVGAGCWVGLEVAVTTKPITKTARGRIHR